MTNRDMSVTGLSIDQMRQIVEGAQPWATFYMLSGEYAGCYGNDDGVCVEGCFTDSIDASDVSVSLSDLRAAIASHGAVMVAGVPGQSICEKALRSITKQDVIRLIDDINRMCVEIQNTPDFTNEVIEALDKKNDELRAAAESYVLAHGLKVDLDKVFNIALFLRWSQLEKDHGHD